MSSALLPSNPQFFRYLLNNTCLNSIGDIKADNVLTDLFLCIQMLLKNLTHNAKNLAANAKMEDMSRLIKNHMAGKQDVKNALSGVMVRMDVLFLSFLNHICVFPLQT